ncbi:MAG: hypothetical protein ABIH46_11165 [Chloroflexota bacterium]
MRIVSFSWTTPALVALRKSCTRRDWPDSYARRFHAGQRVQAYDKSARHGGQAVAIIQLTMDPYKERTSEMPDQDYELEGFQYFDTFPQELPKNAGGPLLAKGTMQERFLAWRAADELLWVVRFRVLKLLTPRRILQLGLGM